jgi:hypothetical protein
MNIDIKTVHPLMDTKTNESIRDHKSYKKSIERVTTWQMLLAEEEERIMEYFAFKRALKENCSKKCE